MSLSEAIEPGSLSELLWNPGIYWFWAAASVVMGLLFGSFLNVCIYRVPAGLSVNKPRRSFCFRCGTGIAWYDNIPVLSYFLLRGRCRSCGSRFSMRYAAIELLTGGLFLAVFLATNPSADAPFHFATFWFLAFTCLLIVGSFTDIDNWIIPDGITLGGAAAALVAAVVIGLVDRMPFLAEMGPFPVLRLRWENDPFFLLLDILQGPVWLNIQPEQIHWWEPAANSLVGALVGSGLLYMIGVFGKLVFRKDAMGMGDVKLFALIGATLGATGAVVTLMLACVIGAVAGIAGKVIPRSGPGTAAILRLGPERFGGEIADAPEAAEGAGDPAGIAFRRLAEINRNRPRRRSVHHLPFGPWIALGALFVLVFQDYVIGVLQRWFTI